MTTKVNEHQVGSQFEMNGIIYEVVENFSCEGCAFMIEEENICTKPHGIGLLCSHYDRRDNKNVIYKKIKETEYIQHFDPS